MQPVRIEIVIPVHNRRELTRECLNSLEKIDRRNLCIHIVVVDDGSTDGTADMLAEDFTNVQVVTGDGNLWYTAASNRGIEAAMLHDPDYVLLINNDSVFDPAFLRSMVYTAETNARSVVGAILLNWDEPERIFQVSPKWKLIWGGMRHWRKQTIHTIPTDPWKVDLIVGNCVLFPARAIVEAGLMDERRLPQFGDAEYTPRMKRMGWDLLIEPRARVYCKPNDIPPTLKKMSFIQLFRELFANPHGGHSLKRRFHMSLGSAPNKLLGLGAFAIFFLRLALGRNVEGRWAENETEAPLSEAYSKQTVERPQPLSSKSHH